MRNTTTCFAVAVVAVCVATATLATPALAGVTTLRGWRLDGTGLLVRGASGALEPADWTWATRTEWSTVAAMPGYENQGTELEPRGDSRQDLLDDPGTPDAREWDERGAPQDALRESWGDPGYENRDDDRYHAYADGAEY